MAIDETDLAYRFKHGWIRLRPDTDVETKAAKGTADVVLLHKVRKGTATEAEKAEAKRRGGLDYLDLPPSEFVKPLKSQDKSKADPARAEAKYQDSKRAAATRLARKAGKRNERGSSREADVEALEVMNGLPAGIIGRRIGRKSLVKPGNLHPAAAPDANAMKVSAAKQLRSGKLAELQTATKKTRHMSDAQVRMLRETLEEHQSPDLVMLAALRKEEYRRHHSKPTVGTAKAANPEQVKAEDDARREYNQLRAKHDSSDPRVEKAKAKWLRLVHLNGGPTSQNDGDLMQTGRMSHDQIKRYEHGMGFSMTGQNELDLAMKAPRYRSALPRKPRPQSYVQPPHQMQTAAKNFRKSVGAKSLSAPKAQAVLARRAAKPGHFRAKAILAAQSGNPLRAKRLLAKSALAKARRAPVPAAPKPATHPVAGVFRPPGPRPVKAAKPPKRGPRKVSLSNVDLAKPGQRYTHGWVPLADGPLSDFDAVFLRQIMKEEGLGQSDALKRMGEIRGNAKQTRKKVEARLKLNNAKALRYLKTHPNAGR